MPKFLPPAISEDIESPMIIVSSGVTGRLRPEFSSSKERSIRHRKKNV